METHSFTSSLIDTMSRNGDNVIVNWKTGGSTEFFNVPENVWHDWRTAESVGKFYHANIKDQYGFKKL
jgi:hypothetical protein